MLYGIIVVTSRFFIQPKKVELARLDQDPASLLIDMVHMKEVILLKDQSLDEIGSLRSKLAKPLPLAYSTAKTITAAHIPRYLLAQLVIPVLIIYGFYAVDDANGLFQITIVILCTFQFAVAFENLSMLEASMEEYKTAEQKLRRVIDTSGLGFVFYNDDGESSSFLKRGKARARRLSRAQSSSSETTDSGNSDAGDTMVAVELENINVEYAFPNGTKITVLRDMGLKLEYGQRVGVIGESVSAKYIN